MAAVQSYKSKVLNLYSQDELAQFKIVPGTEKAQFEYKQGAVHKFIDFNQLSVQDVDVHSKMFENAQAVLTERGRAAGAEQAIQAELDTEEARAASEEQRIEGLFTAEKARVQSQESNEAAALAAEILARETKDLQIDQAIANEAATRQAADSVHTQAIVDEESRAQGEEARIENKFDSYKASNDARATADELAFVAYQTSNDSKLDDHIAAFDAQKLKQVADNLTEKARAETAEQGLQSQITNILSNSDPASLDSLSEIVNKFNADGVTYANRLTALESVVQALVDQLN